MKKKTTIKKIKLTTRKGMEKEWKKAVSINQDEYGWAVIKVIAKVGKALDEKKTPKEAEQIGIKGSNITGYMAGVMAQMISHLHPRGEEFRKWWNKRWVSKPQKGAINPALATVSDVAEKPKKDSKKGLETRKIKVKVAKKAKPLKSFPKSEFSWASDDIGFEEIPSKTTKGLIYFRKGIHYCESCGKLLGRWPTRGDYKVYCKTCALKLGLVKLGK